MKKYMKVLIGMIGLLFVAATPAYAHAVEVPVVSAEVMELQTSNVEIAAEVMELQTSNAEISAEEEVLNGWQGDKYYKNGKAVNGWQKIDGYYYYFKKNILQKNTIAGTKTSGLYYVGPDGIRVTDTAMKQAVSFVLKNSSRSDTRAKRLLSCSKALMKNMYYHMSTDAPEASDISSYASFMFKNRRGNCYRFAASMCYVALALGYEARTTAGGVTAQSGRTSLSRHGWCEVNTKGEWRIWDLSMQKRSSKKLTNVSRDNYPHKLRCIYVYKNKIAKGHVTWKRVKESWSNTNLKVASN